MYNLSKSIRICILIFPHLFLILQVMLQCIHEMEFIFQWEIRYSLDRQGSRLTAIQARCWSHNPYFSLWYVWLYYYVLTWSHVIWILYLLVESLYYLFGITDRLYLYSIMSCCTHCTCTVLCLAVQIVPVLQLYLSLDIRLIGLWNLIWWILGKFKLAPSH